MLSLEGGKNHQKAIYETDKYIMYRYIATTSGKII